MDLDNLTTIFLVSLLSTMVSSLTRLFTELFQLFWPWLKERYSSQRERVLLVKYTRVVSSSGSWFSPQGEELNMEMIQGVIHHLRQAGVIFNRAKAQLQDPSTGLAGRGSVLGNRRIELVPQGLLQYQGMKIEFSEEKAEKEMRSLSLSLTLSSSSRSLKEIEEFLHQSHQDYLAFLLPDHQARFFYQRLAKGTHSVYKKYRLNSQVTLEDVYFPQKEELLRLLEQLKKGQLPRLTLLLHGEPGCGKTSIIKSLANELERSVIEVNLSTLSSDSELCDLFHSPNILTRRAGGELLESLPPEKRIYILEDVDAESHILLDRQVERKELLKKEEPDGVTLAGFLNNFDGLLEIQGPVIVLTTNHPEKLDPAVIRNGRITASIKLGRMFLKEANQMVERYFSQPLPTIREGFFTPARLESLCRSARDYTELVKMIEREENS